MKKVLRLATAGLLAMSLLAGCGTSSSGTDTGTPSGSDAGTGFQGEIKIGADLELTGQAATFGGSTQNGIKLAFKQQNEKGGVLNKELVLVSADNKSDPAEATAAATKLISQDKVVAILGAVASTNTLAIVPVATDYKVPVLTSSSTNTDVTVLDGKLRPYAFRSCFIDPFQGQVAANFASNTLKVKNAAILIEQSSDYSKGLAAEFKKAFTANGGTIVDEEQYVKNDKDFKTVLTRIKGFNPDLIFIPGFYNEVGLIIKQAREAGIDVALLGGDGWDSPELINLAGASNLNNAYMVNHVAADDPSLKSFVDAYKTEYGKDPDALSFLGYDAARMLIRAIEDAGSAESAKIRDALEKVKDFDGLSGKITIDPATHNPVKSAVVLELKDGVQTFLTRVEP